MLPVYAVREIKSKALKVVGVRLCPRVACREVLVRNVGVVRVLLVTREADAKADQRLRRRSLLWRNRQSWAERWRGREARLSQRRGREWERLRGVGEEVGSRLEVSRRWRVGRGVVHGFPDGSDRHRVRGARRRLSGRDGRGRVRGVDVGVLALVHVRRVVLCHRHDGDHGGNVDDWHRRAREPWRLELSGRSHRLAMGNRRVWRKSNGRRVGPTRWDVSSTNRAWAGQVGHGVHGLVDKVRCGASLGVLLGGLCGSLLLASGAVDLLGNGRVVASATSTSAVGARRRAAALDLAKG